MNIRQKFDALPKEVRQVLINKHLRYLPPGEVHAFTIEAVYGNRLQGWHIWLDDKIPEGQIDGPFGVCSDGILTVLAMLIFKHGRVKIPRIERKV